MHEGDWEAVSVIVDLRGRPLVVGLSRHDEGARRDWAKAPKRGQRPLVHVALGSHANYFAPGAQPLDPRTIDPTFIRVIRAYGVPPVDHAGSGRVVRPRLVRVTGTTPALDGVRRRMGRGRVGPLPRQRADPDRSGPCRPRLPRAVAEAGGRGAVLAEGLKPREAG